MKVGVTGANGFVGRAVVNRLLLDGHSVIPLVRENSGLPNEVVIGDLTVVAANSFPKIDALIHLAAITSSNTHTNDKFANRLFDVNVLGTNNAVNAAIYSGAIKIIFISSAKVNGEISATFLPFCEDSIPHPNDDYGKTKLIAENLVKSVCSQRKVSYTIIRPPLVYGNGAGGNFGRLLKLARSPLPLPLAGIKNKRSLIHVDNLADAISFVLQNEQARDRLFMVSDGIDVSTTELIQILAQAQEKDIHLLPSWPLKLIIKLCRLRQIEDRIFGNLQVNSNKLTSELGWKPPYKLNDTLFSIGL
jgi:nucleoside-diphosphate-sugar epimerase